MAAPVSPTEAEQEAWLRSRRAVAGAAASLAAHVAAADPHTQYTTAGELAAALAGYQPVDSDLTAIAALATTAFGRALLTMASAIVTLDTLFVRAANIPMAATTDIGAATGHYVQVTGTGVTITDLGSASDGAIRIVRFASSGGVLQDNALTILPGNGDISIVANDIAIFVSRGLGAGWRAVAYTHYQAMPVRRGGSGAVTLTGILKGNGFSPFTAAVAGTDYMTPAGVAAAYAAKGANSDITSLSGLTTPLSAAQGGTGQATIAAHAADLRTADFDARFLSLLTTSSQTLLGNLVIAKAAGTTSLEIRSDGSAAQMLVNGYGSNPIARLARAGGTVGAPSALAISSITGTLQYAQWDGVSTMRVGATVGGENRETAPSATANGMALTLNTAAVGGLTVSERFRITEAGELQQGGANTIVDASRIFRARSYTVGTLPASPAAGSIAYCSNETGGAVLVFGDATNWRRVTDRAIAA